MAFATLTAQLKLNIANFSSGLSEAADKMSRFARTAEQSYNRAAQQLNSHNLGLKDTARIVQGIMVSQAFYRITQAIADATSALWEFNKSLDYMHVTYSALFGDAKMATDFMSALQEHSIETIFDYQGLADASKKLLAYGIEYENLMFIMEGLTNLGTMSGDSAALDRIALALGQIYSKGKLSAEEMRQLANAYIPITEIITEKFGLSQADLKNVSDLNLPASEVINAIVDYANENFGSVGDAAMYTITGLQNRIVDTLKVMGATMMKPVTTAYKSFLAYVSRGLETIRAEFDAGGIGGVFEYLVPNESTQQVIRQFIANVRNLFMSLISVGVVAGQVFGNIGHVFITAFNIAAPVITGFINVLAAMLNAILQNRAAVAVLRVALVAAAGAFVLLKVQALSALVITAVTKAVTKLSSALLLLGSIISKHPILALLGALGVTLVGISTASNSANKGISSLFDKLSGVAGGSSSDDVLQRVNQSLQSGADAADQFKNRLNGVTDATEGLSEAIGGTGKAADKASKKTGGLLSFDEVYKLNTPADAASDSGTGSGIDSGLLGDIEGLIEGLGNLGDALIPEIPDFGDFISDFTDDLFGSLPDNIVDKLESIGIGALIGGTLGAIIGGIIGGPSGAILGARIGTFAGSLAGLLFDALDGAISNMLVGAGAGIVSAISTGLAKAGATTFGQLLKNLISQGSIKGFFSGLANVLKSTGAKSLLKGGIIGAIIGIFVDGLAHLLWSTLEDKFAGANSETAKVGQTIGSVIGTVIGAIFGGPGGAIIGSAIGTFAGGLVGLFWQPLKEGLAKAGEGIANFTINGLTNLANFIETTKTNFTNWRLEVVRNVEKWSAETSDKIATWTIDGLSNLVNWWKSVETGFTDWRLRIVGSIEDWYEETTNKVVDWTITNLSNLADWWSDVQTGFTNWRLEVVRSVEEWQARTLEKISTWATDTYGRLSSWWSNVKQGYNDWKTSVVNTITTWFTDTVRKITTWATDTNTKVSTWITDTKNSFNKWKNDNVKIISEFASAALKSVGSWLGDTFNKMKTWFSDTKSDVKTWWENLFKPGSWKSGWTSVKEWFTDLRDGIRNWFTSLKTSITSWWDGLWDGKEVSVNTNMSGGRNGISLDGHAYGGIFDREHVARFAEGNKAEAVIPLENARAMQPFVDAVSNGIVSSLAPIVAHINPSSNSQLPPLYVGTLVADDRGLRELYKRFEIIQVQESARRGLTPSGVF